MNPADRSPAQAALPEPAPAPLPPPPSRPGRPRPRPPARAQPTAAGLTGRDAERLLFVAEMHGVQLDLLAAIMRTSGSSARAAVTRWQQQGLAGTARLGPGAPWVWLTRSGLTACGRPYRAIPPALSRLAHLRAVTAARLALEREPEWRAGGAWWRSERRLSARLGARGGRRDHLPDGEIHWPDDSPAGLAWAGECWAIEAELTRKTAARTTAIMRELLTRTGDYGVPAAEVLVPGFRPRHDRVLYLCSPAARPTVQRARAALAGPEAARVEIRLLPESARLSPGDDQ
ncbi:MAG TPA: hypothetical protein VF204_10025 [Streptosporangiaceae bacterium]